MHFYGSKSNDKIGTKLGAYNSRTGKHGGEGEVESNVAVHICRWNRENKCSNTINANVIM